MKKYELTDETRVWEGRTLHRIRALIELELDTGDTVKPGDLGGWVENELNLAQESNAWIADEAIVCDNARCYQSGLVCDNAVAAERRRCSARRGFVIMHGAMGMRTFSGLRGFTVTPEYMNARRYLEACGFAAIRKCADVRRFPAT